MSATLFSPRRPNHLLHRLLTFIGPKNNIQPASLIHVAPLIFLLVFQFSFFLCAKPVLLLLLLFVFVFFSRVTHIRFSLFGNDLRQTVVPKKRLRSQRLEMRSFGLILADL